MIALRGLTFRGQSKKFAGIFTLTPHILRNSIPTILFLLTTSCGLNHETNVESGTREGTLHIGNGDEPRELDPHVVTGSIEHNLCMALLVVQLYR
ncbi:MAG: hypothetical protein OXG54_02500 [Gammaproteobacteria bacterium]|nr:hypothetical protein [Gammaproteobacteria bacterium]